MNFIKGLLGKYPVLIAGAVNIGVAVAARYGVHVTADQLAAVVSVATAVLSGLAHKATSKSAPPAGGQAS